MDLFKEVINGITPKLKEYSFKKTGSNFYKSFGENWSMINFQKSNVSDYENIKFTVNFGIYSNLIATLLERQIFNGKPRLEQCQWQARITDFMPDCSNFWLTVNENTNLTLIVYELTEIIQDIILKKLDNRSTDDALIQCWLKNEYGGATELDKFKYITLYLNSMGDYKTLNIVIEDFLKNTKGRPNEIRGIEFLKEKKIEFT